MREIRTSGLMSGDGKRGVATAPILDSTTRCGLRRFKKPTGQEPRAVRSGGSDKRGDAPCRLLQPALRVAFRRASPAPGGSTVCPDTLFAAPMPYLPRRKSNAGDMECEKCGLVGAMGLFGMLLGEQVVPMTTPFIWLGVTRAVPP